MTSIRMEPRLYNRYRASRVPLAKLIEMGLDSIKPEQPLEAAIAEAESPSFSAAVVVQIATAP